MEEEEKGLTLGEIFKVIFKKVWWVLGVTAAVMILFTCLVQFWYNPGKRVYSAQFELRMPDGYSYPNGTPIVLADSVLPENLQAVKNEELLPENKRTGKFKDVNVTKMVSSDGIVFKQTIKKLEDETYSYKNTIELGSKYFKNSEQATEFLRAVVEFPVAKANKIAEEMTYTTSIYDYNVATSYEAKINHLIAQKNYIINIYVSLAKAYSADYVPAGLENAKSMREYIQDISLKFDEREQSALSNTVTAKYYILDEVTYIANAQMQIDSLQIAIQETEVVLAKIRQERDTLLEKDNGIQTVETFNARIADMVQANADRENEIARINKTRDEIKIYNQGDGKAEKDAFTARLDGVRDMLVEETAKAKEVYVAAYKEKAMVNYVNNVIEVKGGLNIIIAAVLGAVIGFVAVSAVILIIDLPKYKKQKEQEQEEAAEREAQEAPAEE